LMREVGLSERRAAACLSVAPATAHHWSVREREASDEQRATGLSDCLCEVGLLS
jgi:hypothetical protein